MTVEQALPWLREHREELLETMEETQDESKEASCNWGYQSGRRGL